MTDPSPTTTPPRQPFAGMPEPEPFYRTPEFRRFLLLIGGTALFAVVALFLVYERKQKVEAEQAAAAREATLPKLLSPAEAEERATRLSTVLEGSLQDTQNGTDFVETTGFRRLLQIVTSFTPEEIEKRAVRRLDYDAALADPDAWRGEFVWTRGIVANLWAERLREPVFGMTDVYRGILTEGDGANGVFFDLTEPPPALELRQDPVDVFGIFYRTVQYEPLAPQMEDQRVRTVPYLVVRSIRKVEEARSSPIGFLSNRRVALIVGLALLLIFIFTTRLLIYLFQRRSRRSRIPSGPGAPSFKQMFETKLRQEKRTQGPRSHP